jgi:hypothetical protein
MSLFITTMTTLRNVRMAVLAERLHTIWHKSFQTMSVRRFFDKLNDADAGRFWSANDTARVLAEPELATYWRMFFDPKHDFPQNFFPILFSNGF